MSPPAPPDPSGFLRELCDRIPNAAVYRAVGRAGEPLRFTYVSAGVEGMLGVAPEAVLADPGVVFAGIVPEDRAAVFAALDHAVRTGEPCDFTYRHRGADVFRWLRCWAFPTPQPGGEVVWEGLILDETRTTRLEQAVAAGEARFRAFMDHSPLIAWMKDADGRYVYLSRPFEELLGVRLADWAGKTDFDVWPEETAREYRENDRRVLAENRAIETLESGGGEGGAAVRWLTFKFPVTDPDGRRFVGAMAVDVSGREHERTELARKNAELQAALAEVRRLESSLVTMCAWTRTVRHGDRWVTVEEYLRDQFGLEVSHGISDAAMLQMQMHLPPEPPGQM